eukprot:CAMPEP_0177172732 /NCGR_PEP_ID=MMETSP0367-20130122/11292_1 /TAXON_ID=447022 ORGANISM="Scrippsiella hangoei-like, Strain SHHI-4" /NCGR_SAMPLE_ID=MMETSP0367 /ASSEMBLY_ACC=CAM_ASM_000362 /LENGTH=117 /DNA_ID=CAMNT_0018619023 /DNA_START=125 /DNA_END=478 /DNA_ORIENTATION=+
MATPTPSLPGPLSPISPTTQKRRPSADCTLMRLARDARAECDKEAVPLAPSALQQHRRAQPQNTIKLWLGTTNCKLHASDYVKALNNFAACRRGQDDAYGNELLKFTSPTCPENATR